MDTEIQQAKQQKQTVTERFDSLASCYNHTALRFFPFCADRLVQILKPGPAYKILDAATGTGVVAIAMAQAVKAAGRVIAVDLSENMLAEAERSTQKMGLTNIDFFTMDVESLEFKSNYFDAVTCSFGLFFLPDMSAALREWRRVTKPGGTVLFTSFAENTFSPMVDYYVEDLKTFGVEMDASSIAGQRLTDATLCTELMQEAGFAQAQVTDIQVGYHLRDADEWWQLIWNSGLRHFLDSFSETQLLQFRDQHLARVAPLVNDQGLWLDVPVHVTTGCA